MAQDLNVVALVGRLTRPCEMRYTNSGYAICSFSLAVNKKKKQQDGTWKDEASFFDCTLFGKLGESLSQYLQKGQQVSVQGSLEQQTWEKDGQKRSKVIVIVDNISLIGNSKSNEGSQNARQPQRQQTSGYGQQNQAQGQYNRPAQTQPVQGPESFQSDNFGDVPF